MSTARNNENLEELSAKELEKSRRWEPIVDQAYQLVPGPYVCPFCGSEAAHATWIRRPHFSQRIAGRRLFCTQCGEQEQALVQLPGGLPDRFSSHEGSQEKEP